MSDMAAVNVKVNPITVAIIACIALFFAAWVFGVPGWSSAGPQVNMKELLSASIHVAKLGGDAVKKIREDGDLHEQAKGKTKEGAIELKSDGDMASHHIMYYGILKGFTDIHVESEENDKTEMDMNSVIDVVKNLPDVKDISDNLYVSASDINVWIDPLDATQEYTENLKQYVTTMVCVAIKGKPTIGVIHRAFTGETAWAYVGQGHSDNLKPQVHDHKDKPLQIIVSRSHSGQVQEIAKASFGVDTEVVPAGGAGYKTLEVIDGKVDAYVHVTDIKKWDICAGNAILHELGGQQTTLYGKEIDYSSSGDPVNTDGLLVSMKDHDKYLKGLKKSFEDLQAAGKSRSKRLVENVEVENYKIANRDER